MSDTRTTLLAKLRLTYPEIYDHAISNHLSVGVIEELVAFLKEHERLHELAAAVRSGRM